MTAHARTGWYEECTEHPMPGKDASDEAFDAWEATHFPLGGDPTVYACEDRRIGDICVACTLALQAREQSTEVCVPWPCAHEPPVVRDQLTIDEVPPA